VELSYLLAICCVPFVIKLIDLWEAKYPQKQAKWPHRLGLLLGLALRRLRNAWEQRTQR
jgi:hypothetical protein